MADLSPPVVLLGVLWIDYVHGGNGRIPVKVERGDAPVGAPLRRRVRLHRDVDGRLIREGWSDAVSGEIAFSGINSTLKYSVTAYDHTGEFGAVVAAGVVPELLA